ncbi:MAG: ABC transporter substrate-binding protein, partial [Chitinophagaceae bacterium]|nr:ABC transporter substrate-binding protein [Chitinophagaceae bacterium]
MKIKPQIVLFVLITFLSSCYNEQNQKNFFHFNEHTGLSSTDPAFAKSQAVMWVVHQLYNTLVEVDTQLHIIPSLAARWTISTDRKTLTFFLRSDVYFHDDAAFANGKGRRMTAHDVEYSFQRIINRETASPGAWIFNGKVDSLQPFKA